MSNEQPVRGRRRSWPWVIAVLGLLVLAIPAWYLASSVTGPAPRLSQVEKEPILVPPIAAVELGRATRQSQYAPGLSSAAAYVVVAYQVESTPEQALAAWSTAYGQRYALHDAHNTPTLTKLTGSTKQVNVSVDATDHVVDPGVGGSYKAPAPGTTVVTVNVSGVG